MSDEGPLHHETAARGARFELRAGRRLAADYGEPAAEVEAARAGAIVADISDWGHFTLGGKDGPKFVQGLTTNDVLGLADGAGRYSAFLNVHGRFETDCHFFKIGGELVIQTPPDGAAWLAQSLGRFRRAGDFRFVELADTHAAVTLVGPRVPELLSELFGRDLGEWGPLAAAEVEWESRTVRLLGVPRASVPAADLLGDVTTMRRLFERLVDGPGPVARPAGAHALDLLRIEAGIPRFGRDFDKHTVLQEIDAPEIVSFTKGCYLGQEVVARLHYLGQPSKLVRRLELTSGVGLPEPGDAVVAVDGDDEKALGRVTSVAQAAGGPVVLATVKKKLYAPGTAVRVRRGDALLPATVAPRAGREDAR